MISCSSRRIFQGVQAALAHLTCQVVPSLTPKRATLHSIQTGHLTRCSQVPTLKDSRNRHEAVDTKRWRFGRRNSSNSMI